MKHFLLFCLLLSLSGGHLFSQDSSFVSGNEAYANGDYELALIAYNQLLATEVRSADVYYNLGNTYFRLNEFGEAVWAYERALKIDPSHTNAAYNRNFVHEQTKAEVNSESGGITPWLKANLFGISINFWPYFTLVIGLLFAIGTYFYFTTKKQKTKNISLSFGLTAFSLLIMGLVLSYLNTNNLTNHSEGIIIVNSASIMAEPSEKASTNFPLKEGAKVQILRSNTDWIEIDFKGHSGWVARDEMWEI